MTKLKTYLKHPFSFLMLILLVTAAVITVASIIFIIVYILEKGIPNITGELFTQRIYSGNEKKTMLIVTHEIAFARNISDRVIFMDGGHIIEEGTPEQVIDNPQNERTRQFLKTLNTAD